MEYCSCGSIIIGKNCTNKRCSKHISKFVSAKADQKYIIKELMEELGKDIAELNFRKMSTEAAKGLIEELEAELHKPLDHGNDDNSSYNEYGNRRDVFEHGEQGFENTESLEHLAEIELSDGSDLE